MQAILVLAILAGVVALLMTERLRSDMVAMLGLAALVACKVLPVKDALSGFSSPATVTVACMFVLSAGLQATGLVGLVADRLLRHGPRTELGLLLLLVFTIAPLSAFINNTAAVVVFMPIVIRACHAHGISPSKLLMPMVFLAILGGTCTMIGTSTNILVSSLAESRGLPPLGLFEISPLGLIFLVVGAAYLLLMGRRLLPERVKAAALTQAHALGAYFLEVEIPEGSPLAGRTLAEAALGAKHQIEVMANVGTGGRLRVITDQEHILLAGDLLVVKAPAAALPGLDEQAGLVLRRGRHLDEDELKSLESALVEVVIQAGSPLAGRTLKQIDFRGRYGATTLAIRRQGSELRDRIGRVRLRPGDELLVLASRERLAGLRRETDFIALQERDMQVLRPGRAVLAIAIVVAVVMTAALGWLPIVSSALVGSVVMVVSGCLPARRIYTGIDWQVVFLLASVIPLGLALEQSGAADVVVKALMETLGGYGPRVVLGAFILMTYILTGVMSNNATAALMFPLAVSTAVALGVSSQPFLVAIMFAASAAFWTPFGYQTNLLVYGPGGYRFTDYTRVGGPLNLIYLVLSVLLIPLLWSF
jgi:di/tricarboxylate transporter